MMPPPATLSKRTMVAFNAACTVRRLVKSPSGSSADDRLPIECVIEFEKKYKVGWLAFWWTMFAFSAH